MKKVNLYLYLTKRDNDDGSMDLAHGIVFATSKAWAMTNPALGLAQGFRVARLRRLTVAELAQIREALA